MTKQAKKKTTTKSHTKSKTTVKPVDAKPSSKTKQYWYGKFNDIFSVQFWVEKYKSTFKKRSLFIAVILLNNGKYDMKTVVDESGYFTYKNKTYVIDIGYMREDVNTNLNMLFYYEGMSIPMKLDINVDSLTKALKDAGQDDITTAINPSTLQSFIKSEVIKQLISSGDLTSEVKSLKTLMFVCIGLTGIVAYYVLKMNGVF